MTPSSTEPRDDGGEAPCFAHLVEQFSPSVDDRALAQLVRDFAEVVVIADPAGIIACWNDAARNLFGWSASDAIGRSLDLTVGLTGGVIEQASEVAERCRDAQPSRAGLRILAALLGHGDTWEQHHVETISVEALRAAAASGLTDETFRHLQERLIQRGRHDAGSIGTEHDEE